MKKIILLLVVLLTVLAVSMNKPVQTRRYIVRENVNPSSDFLSWDEYCWSEYADGYVKKEYLRHTTLYGKNISVDRVTESTCEL